MAEVRTTRGVGPEEAHGAKNTGVLALSPTLALGAGAIGGSWSLGPRSRTVGEVSVDQASGAEKYLATPGAEWPEFVVTHGVGQVPAILG